MLCGALYSHNAQKAVSQELSEAERLLEIFKYLRNEIDEFDTPIYEALRAKGVEGSIEKIFSSVSSEGLRGAISEARLMGRGYKKEELRVCDRVVSRLEEKKKLLDAKAKETKVISRVKGLGTAAAAVILLL